MADITTELTAISNNPYGGAVREAIVDATEEISDSVHDTEDFIRNTVIHNSLFRGRELGSGATFEAASTPEQRAAIQNGSFKDLYIGDYWTINSKVFRIADFNYWKYIGDTSFTQNHLVIVPDDVMGSGKMNTENVTTGAYRGSEMHTDENSALNTARATITSLFGSYLGTHKSYLANTVTDGAESAGAWFDSSVDLMSEIMVYGCNVRAKKRSGAYFYTSDKTQLSLFRIKPEFIGHKRQNWWLRDVVSGASFASVGAYGYTAGYIASDSSGVRPAFPVVIPSNS